MRVYNENLLNEGDASGDLTSSALWLDQMYGFAMQAVFTGSPVGSIKLQGSVDTGTVYPLNPADGAGISNWNDILNSDEAVSGSGVITWNFNGVFYKWVRVVYTSSSGTGTLTVTANAKGA